MHCLEPIHKVVESNESDVIPSEADDSPWRERCGSPKIASADRRGLRYPSDLTGAEWSLVASLIPPARRGGRRRPVDVRDVLNAIFYVLATGCQWEALPKDLPPKSTAHFYFMLWDWDGTLDRIHDALYVMAREAAGREASPSSAIIEPKAPRPLKRGFALDPQGYDAGKKVTGRKRHILVDTFGLLLSVSILSGDIQDRDGTRGLLRATRRRFPLHNENLCRRRLSRTENAERGRRNRLLEYRDRQAQRRS